MAISRCIDLTGEKFGRWTVLNRAENRYGGQAYWLCECECGTQKEVSGTFLRNGRSQSCGCLQRELLSQKSQDNLLNQNFGELKVIEQIRKNGLIRWKCLCSCGETCIKRGVELKSGETLSCPKCAHINGAKKIQEDLVGKVFGKLKVINATSRRSYRSQIWECLCECGNIKYVSGRDLKYSKILSCGCSSQSKGEYEIETILKNNNIVYEKEKTFEDCRFKNTNRKARFDFFVNNAYIIEFDGIQHYEYKENAFNNQISKKEWETNCQRDSYKNDYCFKNNIPLIRIPYTKLGKIKLEDLNPNTSIYLVDKNLTKY